MKLVFSVDEDYTEKKFEDFREDYGSADIELQRGRIGLDLEKTETIEI